MYYVYFLLLANGDIYKGSCSDVQQRLIDHQNGRVKSTQHYLPFHLIGYECYYLKSDALRREKFLKTTEGRRLLKQQYKDIINHLTENISQTGR
ncbi:MAG TPA: GIY-YIG nuclease family protein [bacterium]|nr:GIY-YIG nuclease family protein [bacterium]